MASVNVVNIGVGQNPAPFLQPFAIEVTFECFAPLAEGEEVAGVMPHTGVMDWISKLKNGSERGCGVWLDGGLTTLPATVCLGQTLPRPLSCSCAHFVSNQGRAVSGAALGGLVPVGVRVH